MFGIFGFGFHRRSFNQKCAKNENVYNVAALATTAFCAININFSSACVHKFTSASKYFYILMMKITYARKMNIYLF